MALRHRRDLELIARPDDVSRRSLLDQVLRNEHARRGGRAVETIAVRMQVDEQDEPGEDGGGSAHEQRPSPRREQILGDLHH